MEALEPEVAAIVQSREHSLLSILELTRELTVSLDPYQIADLVLFNLMGHVGTPRSSIWLFSKGDQSRAILLRAYGIPLEKASAIGSVCGRELADVMCEHGEALVTEELVEFVHESGLAMIRRAELEIFAPIFVKKRLVGMVALGRRVGGGGYETVDKQVLLGSLGVLGVALENTSRYSKVSEKNRQLELAYDQLREAERSKADYLRGINQDLKGPLTIILAYAQWLVSEEQDEGKREFLETILSESQKLSGLTERLVDLSSAADTMEFHLEEVELEPVLEQFYLDRHLGIAENLREFRYASETGLPPAETDPNRLEQILQTFVDHAVKLTPQGSSIRLEAFSLADDDGAWISIQLTDNGPGMSQEKVQGLLSTFHREEGLHGEGLALAKQMAERMGAVLEMESVPGKGTSYRVRVPMYVDPS